MNLFTEIYPLFKMYNEYSENDSGVVDDDASLIYDSDKSESFEDNVEVPKKRRMNRRVYISDGSDSSDDSDIEEPLPPRNKRKKDDAYVYFMSDSSDESDVEIIQPKKKARASPVVISSTIKINNPGNLPAYLKNTVFKQTCQFCKSSVSKSIHCNPDLDWQFCHKCVFENKKNRDHIFKYGGMVQTPPNKCIKGGGCLLCAEFKKFQREKK